ncbi:hypothetical protein RvY_15655 [Ramazzottius varieornatus]|uniref:Uncharacterized protein n=1 Tax=Ramazzottius varieornatus TaxID=947166 RepID=A0A1D1VVP3_RAMVA|nr:hypothetical protein RvY_15655 [Ramazzottius varieornatus]
MSRTTLNLQFCCPSKYCLKLFQKGFPRTADCSRSLVDSFECADLRSVGKCRYQRSERLPQVIYTMVSLRFSSLTIEFQFCFLKTCSDTLGPLFFMSISIV